MLLARLIGNQYKPTIFHPQYLASCYMRRSICKVKDHVHGYLLDVGCGSQPYKKILDSKLKRYIGIDNENTFSMVAGARQDVIGDVYALPFKSASFDALLMSQVLEHLIQPERALGQASRLLKRGGLLILSCPQSYPIHGEPFDYFRFTKYAIEYLLNRENFKIEIVESQGSLWTNIAVMVNIYLYKYFFVRLPILRIFRFLSYPLLLIIFFVFNLFALLLERFNCSGEFTFNYFILARKE